MKLKYQGKEINLIECKTFFTRLKGFMFAKKIDKAILFEKCNSIHTFFMKANIDVIMCNKENEILYYYNNLKPNNVILPKKHVYKTLELPVEYFKINVGEKIIIKK